MRLGTGRHGRRKGRRDEGEGKSPGKVAREGEASVLEGKGGYGVGACLGYAGLLCLLVCGCVALSRSSLARRRAACIMWRQDAHTHATGQIRHTPLYDEYEDLPGLSECFLAAVSWVASDALSTVIHILSLCYNIEVREPVNARPWRC